MNFTNFRVEKDIVIVFGKYNIFGKKKIVGTKKTYHVGWCTYDELGMCFRWPDGKSGIDTNLTKSEQVHEFVKILCKMFGVKAVDVSKKYENEVIIAYRFK